VRSERGLGDGFRTWVTLLWFEVTGLGWFFQYREVAKGASFYCESEKVLA
jgi:hypothetical protein